MILPNLPVTLTSPSGYKTWLGSREHTLEYGKLCYEAGRAEALGPEIAKAIQHLTDILTGITSKYSVKSHSDYY